MYKTQNHIIGSPDKMPIWTDLPQKSSNLCVNALHLMTPGPVFSKLKFAMSHAAILQFATGTSTFLEEKVFSKSVTAASCFAAISDGKIVFCF